MYVRGNVAAVIFVVHAFFLVVDVLLDVVYGWCGEYNGAVSVLGVIGDSVGVMWWLCLFSIVRSGVADVCDRMVCVCVCIWHMCQRLDNLAW